MSYERLGSKTRRFTQAAYNNAGHVLNFGAAAATGIGLVAAAPIAAPVAAGLGVSAAIAYLAAALRESKRRDEKSMELIRTVNKTLSILQKYTGTLSYSLSENIIEVLKLLQDTKMRTDDFSRKLLTICNIITLEIEDYILEHLGEGHKLKSNKGL